ncbi:hypothetical protein [Methanoculleus chikugoensis]|uniref:hypothetical protein n=1 Tax=Methanoculleus chikugoensis TaxID=118126 RepID=UPI001FB45ACA|nr:hypothetical protein [Methanoculleus chikugoensis]
MRPSVTAKSVRSQEHANGLKTSAPEKTASAGSSPPRAAASPAGGVRLLPPGRG